MYEHLEDFLMPTWQFDSHLNPDGSVVIPPDVAVFLQPDDPLRVIISTDQNTEAGEWQRMAAAQFLQGYGPGDEIYDQLPTG
jgi:hypothetical protein